MSTSWRTTEEGSFEVVDRQGLVAKLFGGLMLFFGGLFLYWLAPWVVDVYRTGTLRYFLTSLPGVIVALVMAALFGVPGMLMAFLKTRTLFDKADGMSRQYKSFGLFRRVREMNLADVGQVVCIFRTTRSSNFNRSGGGACVHTVELILSDNQRLEVAQLEKYEQALDLGRQLAGFLGKEFRER